MRPPTLLELTTAVALVWAGPAPAGARDAAPPHTAAPAPAPATALPIGNGAEFRRRLLSWQAPPLSQVATAVEFRLPAIATRVSSYFGVRGDPLGRGTRMHAGIDLPDRLGAPVVSSAGGIVVSAGWARGYGNMVEIDHGDGVRTRYAHLSRVLVFAGRPIEGGEIVGLVGSTGRSTGNHLHFEVRQDGRATNPLTFAWERPAARIEPGVPVRKRGNGWRLGAVDERLPMPSLE